RFNGKGYHYPYVFLNDEPFSEEFKKHTSGIASGVCSYGTIPRAQWKDHGDWIDEEKAGKTREEMKAKGVIYGDSVSYREMCRYQSGFFWRHPLLDQYDYYWRI
ncbi:glycosyl transferase, partial [Leucosporidium creatinivorum]